MLQRDAFVRYMVKATKLKVKNSPEVRKMMEDTKKDIDA